MDQLYNSGYYTYRVLPDGTAEITAYAGEDEMLDIPSELDGKSVTGIGESVFSDRRCLKSVTIPGSVTRIGCGAFSRCTRLTSITLPGSVKEIDFKAFFPRAYNLILTVQKDSYAEQYCKQRRLKYRYSDAFPASEQDPDSSPRRPVYRPVVPSRARQLDDAKMKKIADMLISLFAPEMANQCGDYTFSELDDGTAEITKYSGNAETLEIPVKVNGRIVTSIGKHAFEGCSSLTSVTIPDGVTNIGEGAFYKCSGLDSVTIPKSVTSLCDSAFFGCSQLCSVTIPDGVTIIGRHLFFGCVSLPAVKIPEGVTSIGDGAFAGCSSLKSIKIPGKVTSIGGRAFLNCGGLTTVTVPEGVASIGSGAFGMCVNLASVTLPGSVTSIGEFAFINCAEDLTLTVPKDSYAEEYCREKGLKYRYSKK